MALVSVIVPCYNSARFLKETLASIRAQTHPAVETILVNDGTDNPQDLQLLRELGGTVNRRSRAYLQTARKIGARFIPGGAHTSL